jgi:DNA repair exonuclease SbcCD ATPase subunit
MQEVNENIAKTIKEKQKLINETENKVKDLNKKYSDLETQIETLCSKTEDEETVSKKINKISKLRHQIEAKVSLLNSDLDFFKNHENCPTCKQHIAEDFRLKTIEEKNIQKKEIEDGLNLLLVEYETTNNRLNQIMELINEIRSLEMKKIECKTTINSLTKYSRSLEEEIDSLQKPIKTVSEDKVADFQLEIKQIEGEYNKLIEERNLLTAAGILLKDGGIKSKIVKQYIPVINKLINKYLSAMDFFVSFELDEQFNETIKSRYRDDFTYASFSEGEKQKIDLALLFTWRAVAKLRNSINTNLLIMDEVFDSSLDMNAVDYLMNIIRDISKDSNIIIISHKEHLNEKFNNVLKFVKNKNFSQIQE